MKKQITLALIALCICAQADAATMYKVVKQGTQKVPGTAAVFTPTDLAKKKTAEGKAIKKGEKIASLHEMCNSDVCVLEESEEGVFKTEKFSDKKKKKYVGTSEKDGGKVGVFVKAKRPVKDALAKGKKKRKARRTDRQQKRKAVKKTVE